MQVNLNCLDIKQLRSISLSGWPHHIPLFLWLDIQSTLLWHFITSARGKANKFPSVTFETSYVQRKTLANVVSNAQYTHKLVSSQGSSAQSLIFISQLNGLSEECNVVNAHMCYVLRTVRNY